MTGVLGYVERCAQLESISSPAVNMVWQRVGHGLLQPDELVLDQKFAKEVVSTWELHMNGRHWRTVPSAGGEQS